MTDSENVDMILPVILTVLPSCCADAPCWWFTNRGTRELGVTRRMALTVWRGDLVGDQEGASMGDAHPAIGRASQHEVMMDVILSPTDMWFTHGLDMPTGRVAQAVTRP